MIRVLVVFLVLTSALLPWGLRGHRIVAHIAQNHLNTEALKQITIILDHEPLSRIANEVDGYRAYAHWKCASPLHYASVEDKETYLDSEISSKGDIVQALVYFEGQLRDKTTPAREKMNALKWLVHLIGDIHQPLHVGRSCDRGGNSVETDWLESKTNLHKVWDSQFINYEELSYSEYAQYLDHAESKILDSWTKSTYLDWVKEAQDLRTQVYTCWGRDGCCANPKRGCKIESTVFDACSEKTPDVQPILGYTYIEKNRDMLNRQLLKAGLRLAAVLNRIYAETPVAEREAAAAKAIEAARKDKGNPVDECIKKALETPN